MLPLGGPTPHTMHAAGTVTPWCDTQAFRQPPFQFDLTKVWHYEQAPTLATDSMAGHLSLINARSRAHNTWRIILQLSRVHDVEA